MLRNVIITLMVTFSLLSWGDEAEDAKNARALAQALQENMVATYPCQKIMGGLGHYRAAKLIATETFSRITGDRNKAVLTINQVEEQIKASNADKNLEAQFAEMKLSEIDSVSTCQQLIDESMDKVELLQAKLRLL